MKIIYHHRIRSRDGQSVHLEELISALRDLGHEVRLVGPAAFARAEFGHDPKLLAAAKRMIPAGVYALAELGYNLPAYFRLLSACRSFGPDVIYERENLFCLAGILAAKTIGKPLLLEVNAPLARERSKFGGLGLAALARRLERWVWLRADRVLPVTEVLAQEIVASGVSRREVVVIPNAIDPRKFAPDQDPLAAKAEFGLSGKLVLGITGFLRSWHGLDSVLELLARPEVPADLHFLAVGEGPAIPEARARARALGVESGVTFAGLVARARMARVIAAFDIALIPGCVEYCSPLKLFEYMACGKAIVAPDQANIREILTDGLTGLLFDPGGRDSFPAAIMRLVRDPDLRVRLGAGARAAALNFTWQRNAERVIEQAGALTHMRHGAVAQVVE